MELFESLGRFLMDCGRSELTLDDVEVTSEEIVFKPLRLCVMKDCILPVYSIRREKTEIWIVNGQSQEKIIPKGMCVAFAEPFCPDCIDTISETSRAPTEISETKQSFEFQKLISPDLDANQKRMFVDVLQEYSEAFNESKNVTPQITVQHRINTGDNLPVNQRAYRVTPAERRIIHDEVEKMLDRGIMQPSKSPWSSPDILVRKKDNTWSFCVDYRRLNRITKKDVYPLPRIDDSLDSLQESKLFSSMDLSSGYWQIETGEADREKTAFITPEGFLSECSTSPRTSKNDSKFTWRSDQKESFEKLKTALTSEPALELFDKKAPTELYADASGYGLDAVLVQIQKGKEKVKSMLQQP
ncbi:hypothetical protein TNCV_2735381 [Trichonephila clavipes]|nr:hypothetical protein TNCV_2735381 [Trichonephila clavipes]